MKRSVASVARQYLADRREVRAVAARVAREVRAERANGINPRGLLRAWRAMHWRGFDHGTRWAMHWGFNGTMPANPTPARLRAEARNCAAYSREPVRPSYCGREDAESDRKMRAGELAAVLFAAAKLAAIR